MRQLPPVLMFHGVAGDNRNQYPQDKLSAAYRIPANQFVQQLQFLRENSYHGMSYHDWVNHSITLSPDTEPVIITFDDGEANNHTMALPILRGLGMTATFYITTDYIDQPGWLTTEQIKQLSELGMEIGSHGTSHRFFSMLSQSEIMDELCWSKSILEVISQHSVTALSLPGGRGLSKVLRHAKSQGYKSIGTSAPIIPNTGLLDILPRWVINNHTTVADLLGIVQRNGTYVFRTKMKYKIGKYLKYTLGDNLYDKLWNLTVLSKQPVH